MKTYNLNRQQIIHAPIAEVWDFFSNPSNLNALTPGDMGFKITSRQPLDKMYEGQVIDYKVSPLLGIPLKWRTRITKVKEGAYFTDEQLKGPYALWIHTHYFEMLDTDRVLMRDELEYALPLGFLGRIAHKVFIRERLHDIFDFRYDKVEELFNKNTKSERADNPVKALSV